MACALLWLATCLAGTAGERTLLEWNFNQPGDLQGWQPNGHLREVTVSNGCVSCRAVGSDPILELRPLLELKATPWQIIEVRMKATADGTAEFFWSNTATGRYQGFSQEKTTRFNVIGDGQWHTYRHLPFWHAESKIVRLRFDVYDGARFEIDSLRIIELTTPPTATTPAFDFSRGAEGWQTVSNANGFSLSPPLQIEAAKQDYVSVRLALPAERANVRSPAEPAMESQRATFYFATADQNGLASMPFPVEADGRERTYNLDMLDAPGWQGKVIALGLRLPDGSPPAGTLKGLAVSSEPQGPAQLEVLSFAVEDALPRVGVPASAVARVTNTGGRAATNLQAILSLPEGLRILSASPQEARVASLGFGEEGIFHWRLQADRPVTGTAELQVTAGDTSPGEPAGARPNLTRSAIRAKTGVSFASRLPVAGDGYVPAPKPVRGPHEVGVYYFPGWKNDSQWHPIRSFPERKPVLGWYREGDPEVADWHIKWAVEHGITFFAYDWYWSQGSRQLEHGLHDGYFKARYRNLLKFCLLWANHNPPNSSSHEDCLSVTRYWIEQYFRRPEHLSLDGKPIVIIFSPHRLTEDLGSTQVRKTFEAMRSECRQAGLRGLYLVACVGDVGGARQATTEGYDAVTAYNWPHLGMKGQGNHAPYETLIAGYRQQWQHLVEHSQIPLAPLPVCGGWDSRPWHGENNLVRYGRTPELFRRHLQDARHALETSSAKDKTRNLILIEAWNEWGEGSYIEPHNEFGFGYLDAIREVFTDAPRAHPDVTPPDAGLGPYDVPVQTLQTAWHFDQGNEGWNSTMDIADLQAAGGRLSAKTTGNDPALFGPPTQARATAFGTLQVRMKLTGQDARSFRDRAQLFWRTSRLPESEGTSIRFEVNGNGEWHDYSLPVGTNARWRGVITRLRLDPCNRRDVQVEIESIRLAP